MARVNEGQDKNMCDRIRKNLLHGSPVLVCSCECSSPLPPVAERGGTEHCCQLASLDLPEIMLVDPSIERNTAHFDCRMYFGLFFCYSLIPNNFWIRQPSKILHLPTQRNEDHAKGERAVSKKGKDLCVKRCRKQTSQTHCTASHDKNSKRKFSCSSSAAPDLCPTSQATSCQRQKTPRSTISLDTTLQDLQGTDGTVSISKVRFLPHFLRLRKRYDLCGGLRCLCFSSATFVESALQNLSRHSSHSSWLPQELWWRCYGQVLNGWVRASPTSSQKCNGSLSIFTSTLSGARAHPRYTWNMEIWSFTAIYRAIHQQPRSRMTREKHRRENRSLVVSSQFLILARPGADRAQGSPNLQGERERVVARVGQQGWKSHGQGWIDIVDLTISRKPPAEVSEEEPPKPQKPKTGPGVSWGDFQSTSPGKGPGKSHQKYQNGLKKDFKSVL